MAQWNADPLAVVHGLDTSTDCSDASCGGGLYNNSGVVVLHAVTFTDHAADRGAAIYNAAGVVSITDSLIRDNTTTVGGGGGGGVANQGAAAIAHCRFIGNSTSSTIGDGGGYNSGSMILAASTFSGNSATITMMNSLVYSNTVTGTGPYCPTAVVPRALPLKLHKRGVGFSSPNR